MFYIGFVARPRTGADGRRRAGGEITLGQDSPAFDADLSHWSASDYDAQWREGVARLATGSSSALVTSYGGPDARDHEIWAMWRTGATVMLRRQSITGATIALDDAGESFYALVGEHPDSATATPEWIVPLGQLLAFTVEQ